MKPWSPRHWDGARVVKALTALLLLALPAWGQGRWLVVEGKRVALSREDLSRFAPLVRFWNLLPSKGPGSPNAKGKGLEGILARRVRPEKTYYDPGAEARTYSLKVKILPGGKERALRREAVLRLFDSDGGKGWLVSFEKTRVSLGKGWLMVWRARLAEGLSFDGLGGRKGLLLDGDGDGYFQSYGKDLMVVLEEKGRSLFPMTAVVLFQTGSYDFTVDREDRVSWRIHQGPMGLLEVRALLRGSSRVRSAVVGTGRVFRVVGGRAPVVPVTPGKWFLFWGRLTGGLAFSVPHPDRSAPGKTDRKIPWKPKTSRDKPGGVEVKAGGKSVLHLGAPFSVDFAVRDRKERLVLDMPRVKGARGEIYRPDPETFGKGEIPLFLVEILVGRSDRQRRRSPLPWIPWVPAGKGRFRRQRLVVPVAANWAPLYIRIRARRGPLSGAVGFQRVR